MEKVCGAHELLVQGMHDIKNSVSKLYDLDREKADRISEIRTDVATQGGKMDNLLALFAQNEQEFRDNEEQRKKDNAAMMKAIESIARRRHPLRSVLKYASIVLTAVGGGAGLAALKDFFKHQ